MLPLFESRLRHCEAKVERRFRPPPRVLVHDGEIRQVVANLVGNATDALGEGGRLLLRTAPARDPKSGEPGVAITVADSRDRALGRRRCRTSSSRSFRPRVIPGPGLGLWVSLEIVERHEGTLRVKSRKGAGTVFRLFLPATSAAVAEAG